MKKLLWILASAGLFLSAASCLGIGLIASLTGLTLRYESSSGARVIRLAPLVTPERADVSVLEATLPPVDNRVIPSPTAPILTLEGAPVATAAVAVPQPTTTLPPDPTAVPLPAAHSDGYVTRLVIPKLGLDAAVVLAPVEGETWNVEHLEQQVGHLERTAAPGANSNLVLAGHVRLDSGVEGPFARLDTLLPNDIVQVYRGEQSFRYVIDHQQVVDPGDVRVTYPTSEARLTLITCNGWNETLHQYTERLVVTGHLVQD